jgi:hypothetical protein
MKEKQRIIGRIEVNPVVISLLISKIIENIGMKAG